MFSKKVISNVKNVVVNNYRFHVNDLVLCTTKGSIKDTIVLSKYKVGNDNYYKIGNKETTQICKEKELIHR